MKSKRATIIVQTIVIAMLLLGYIETRSNGQDRRREEQRGLGSNVNPLRPAGNCTPPPIIFSPNLVQMTEWLDPIAFESCFGLDFSEGGDPDVDGDGKQEFIGSEFKPTETHLFSRLGPTGLVELIGKSPPDDASWFVLPSAPFTWDSATADADGYYDADDDGLHDALVEVTLSDSGTGNTWMALCYAPNTLTPPPPALVGDVNGDDLVNTTDLLLLIINWSP